MFSIHIFPTDYYAKRYVHFFPLSFCILNLLFHLKIRKKNAYDLFGHDFV